MGIRRVTPGPDCQAFSGVSQTTLEAEIADLVRHFCPGEADARRLAEEVLRQTEQTVKQPHEPVMPQPQMRRMLFCLIHALMTKRS